MCAATHFGAKPIVMDALSLAVKDESPTITPSNMRMGRRASTGSMGDSIGDSSAPEGAAASKARLKEAQDTVDTFAQNAFDMIIERLQPARDAMGEDAPAFSEMQDRLKYVRLNSTIPHSPCAPSIAPHRTMTPAHATDVSCLVVR